MPVYSTDKGRLCPDCGRKPCACTVAAATLPDDGFVRLQRQVKGRNGKPVILISGVPGTPAELKKLAKQLKARCGVGGSIEGQTILIQGDQRDVLQRELEIRGYKVKQSGG